MSRKEFMRSVIVALAVAGIALSSVVPAAARGSRFHDWRHDSWRTSPTHIWSSRHKVCGWTWHRGHYVWGCWWR